MKTFPLAIAGALLCLAQAAFAGSPQQLDLNWSELGPRIGHNKVSMALPGGVYVEGKVLEVRPDGLWMNISKTSDKAVQPKGKHLIPRQSVSVLHVTEYRKMARLLCTLGAAGLAGGIAAASYPDLYEGTVLIAVPAAVAAGTTGTAVGGYFVGKKLDLRDVTIRIIRGSAQPD